MPRLTLDHFAAAADAEAARYRVLAGLQDAHAAFQRGCVFPHLSDLIRLRRDLTSFLDGVGEHREAHPGRVEGVDWTRGRLLYDADEDAPALPAEHLARWAVPHLDETIEEGRVLYDFVEEQATFSTVGLVPSYQDEGFLIVRGEGEVSAVLRYTLSALTGQSGRYRSLRTAAAEVNLDPMATPEAWKRALTTQHPDLPAPATFCVTSDISFPFDATLLPVAKRKLMRWVVAHGET